MKATEFETLRENAVALFKAQPNDKAERVSLDAVFAALAANQVAATSKAAPKVRKVNDEAPPDWFNDTLAELKRTGGAFNAGRFLLLAGRFPATRQDSLNVGRWLRDAGLTPRKTSGQNIYELPTAGK